MRALIVVIAAMFCAPAFAQIFSGVVVGDGTQVGPSISGDNSWQGKNSFLRINLTPKNVDPTVTIKTVGVGDNTTQIGVSNFYFSVEDDPSVTTKNKGDLYGGQISVRPLVSRNNTPFDDAAALVVQNSTPNKSKATDAIYVGHNEAFSRSGAQSEMEWVTSFLTYANSNAAYRGAGVYDYGFDLCWAPNGCAGINRAPLRAPLMSPTSSTASCDVGALAWSADAIYVCTSQDHWRRAALADF